MLVVVPLGDLIDAARREIGDEHVQPPVVVEVREALRRVGLVQIACDDSRIAGGIGRLRSRHRRDEGDAFAVGRPRNRFAGTRERRVRAGHLGDQARARAIGPRDCEAGLVADAGAIGDPLSVG